MKNKLLFYLCAASLTVSFISCNNGANKAKNDGTTIDTFSTKMPEAGGKSSKNEILVSHFPLPFELLDQLNSSGVAYRQDVMNPVSNLTKYSQTNSKAINLGVYGADLAYAVTFEQFQIIGTYIKNTKKLAEDLIIPVAFNQEALEKYSKFSGKKDSLAKVVYDSYTEVDKTLKSNDRAVVANLVATGSWLEGLYLTTKTYSEAHRNTENSRLYKSIFEQKTYFEKSISSLSEFKTEPYVANLLKDLVDIKSVYEHLEKANEINEKELTTLNQKIEKLRNRIIEGL